jgi:ankyrin repeat protein
MMTTNKFDDLLIDVAAGREVSSERIFAPNVEINSVGKTVKRTLLMAAAFSGNTNLISQLVSYGAKIDLSNELGVTALHEAAAEGQFEAAESLIRLGANPEAETLCGSTPLMVAAAWGNSEIVSLLLRNGATLDRVDMSGANALAIADEKGQESVVEMLMKWKDQEGHSGASMP